MARFGTPQASRTAPDTGMPHRTTRIRHSRTVGPQPPSIASRYTAQGAGARVPAPLPGAAGGGPGIRAMMLDYSNKSTYSNLDRTRPCVPADLQPLASLELPGRTRSRVGTRGVMLAALRS